MSTFHGPQLPPNFKASSVNQQNTREEEKPACASESIPESSGVYFGPALPPKLENHENDKDNFRSRVVTNTEKVIGPSLPPEYTQSDVPDRDDGSDAEEICGPLLPGSENEKRSHVHNLLEIQAEEIKRKFSEKGMDSDMAKIASRETWMLELPEGRSTLLGMGSRTFKKKEGPDMSDRSMWTDTPEDRRQKQQPKMDLKEESRRRAIEAKDAHMEEELKKSKHKHRKKSLLEQHEKKLRKEKKKKKKKNEPEERRCFSREIDLQVNRFDEAKRKSVIKKAALLNDRFSSGESKFL